MEEAKEESALLVVSPSHDQSLLIASSEENKDEWEDPAYSASLRRHVAQMDSLDYIEPYDQPGRVIQLIEAEMKAMATQYSPDPIESVELSGRATELLRNEMARLDSGEEMAPLALDRYTCNPPEHGDASDWTKALNNCSSQLEQQTNRVLNLELLETFGEAAWQRHIQDLQGLKAQLDNVLQAKRRHLEAINIQRKAHQESVASHILHYEHSYNTALHQQMELSLANVTLRHEIRQIEAELERRGISFPQPLQAASSG